MPNRNYQSGRRLEQEVCDRLRADGYDVIRSAGSKGPVDVVAFKGPQVLFIQAKTNGRISPSERAAVLRVASGLAGARALVAHRPGVTLRQLTGPGPRDWEPFTTDEVNA